MGLVTTKTLILSVILLFGFAAVILYLNYQLLSLLKENHPAKWQELGSPTLVMSNSIRNNLAILKFLKNQEYLEMRDQRLTRISRFVWYLGGIYLFLLVGAIILLVVALATNSK